MTLKQADQHGTDREASSSYGWSSAASENTAPYPKRQDMKTTPPPQPAVSTESFSKNRAEETALANISIEKNHYRSMLSTRPTIFQSRLKKTEEKANEQPRQHKCKKFQSRDRV